jgi:hypothetical protein
MSLTFRLNRIKKRITDIEATGIKASATKSRCFLCSVIEPVHRINTILT